MPNLEVILDCNEKKCFQEKFLSALPKTKIEKLEVGDIEIRYQGKSIVIIERKEINDLASSLDDGRYHEQKARLKAVTTPCVIYLVEGEYADLDNLYHSNFTYDKYLGCLLNTLVRDPINIWQTRNMEDTVQFVADIMKRLPRYAKEMMDRKVDENEYSNVIKVKKRDNISPKICFINQLRQITGVSLRIAQYLAEIYPNMKSFVRAYDEYNGDGRHMLKNIEIDGRKIGPVVSKRVYEYMIGD